MFLYIVFVMTASVVPLQGMYTDKDGFVWLTPPTPIAVSPERLRVCGCCAMMNMPIWKPGARLLTQDCIQAPIKPSIIIIGNRSLEASSEYPTLSQNLSSENGLPEVIKTEQQVTSENVVVESPKKVAKRKRSASGVGGVGKFVKKQKSKR